MALSKTQQRLKEKLYATWNDRDFVVGIGSMLQGDQEVQQMLDYIDSGEWTTFSDITLKALIIERDRAA